MARQFDALLEAYLAAVREAIERIPGINHDETELRSQDLSLIQRRGRYPRERTVQLHVKIVTHDGYILMIAQHDVATRSKPFAIPVVRYRCFGPDGQPCWWLETPNPTTSGRHFQKQAHEHIRVRDIDLQRLSSLDILELFLEFRRSQRTLEQLREADLRERSWERFPQS